MFPGCREEARDGLRVGGHVDIHALLIMYMDMDHILLSVKCLEQTLLLQPFIIHQVNRESNLAQKKSIATISSMAMGCG